MSFQLSVALASILGPPATMLFCVPMLATAVAFLANPHRRLGPLFFSTLLFGNGLGLLCRGGQFSSNGPSGASP